MTINKSIEGMSREGQKKENQNSQSLRTPSRNMHRFADGSQLNTLLQKTHFPIGRIIFLPLRRKGRKATS